MRHAVSLISFKVLTDLPSVLGNCLKMGHLQHSQKPIQSFQVIDGKYCSHGENVGYTHLCVIQLILYGIKKIRKV